MPRKHLHNKSEKSSDLSKTSVQKDHTTTEETNPKEMLVDEMVQATEVKEPGKSWSRKRRFIFALGFGLGAILAARLKPIVENQDIGVYVDSVREYLFHDLDLSTLLPSNISPDFIFNNLTSLLKTEQEIGDFLPGKQLVLEGVKAKHPVILVPGIISTGLESWSTSDCALKYFRKRLWGTATMLRAVLLDKQCWIQNMKLDPITGLDPTDVKLRAAQGLDAADYFITGYVSFT
ncbi:phospholipid:diacylglycerol acyltransferase [Basidiobolus ranarum]|uniref:Phospholipid:diacylglycerol acyltransferase n=1 Tax=Basidiobolus ranarum TaxID=34480 RepID=A0ABR2X291_9FUNG